MYAAAVAKRIIEDPINDRIILVPTFRNKPLRMMQPSKNSVTTTAEVTQPHTKIGDTLLFLYFSLSTNRLDGLRYLEHENDEDDSGTVDNEAESRTRFSVEVHPMHDAMFGTWVRDE